MEDKKGGHKEAASASQIFIRPKISSYNKTQNISNQHLKIQLL
jgi:hypothetical protein